jgi:hypothetical protein
MAFSLEVQTTERPQDLAAIWSRFLEAKGITVEFSPGFTLEGWNGLVVAKVLRAPASLTRLEVKEPCSGYFECWLDEDSYGFSTASGRTTVDFALQCLCAVALAEHLNAVYVDPQMGESAQGSEALRLAMEEINDFISDPNEQVFRKFVDWQSI